jgi:hypothetical protein
MTEQLVKVEDSKHDAEVFKAISTTNNFKRLQLFGASSDEVKEGKFPMGNFGIVDNSEITNLGSSFNCYVVAWRPKALSIGEKLVFSYDIESPVFKDIMTSDEDGNLYGPEFLLYIPNHDFIPYFLCSKSGRYEAGAFRLNIGKVIELKAIFIKGTKFSWHAPKVVASNVPLETMPSQDQMTIALNRFNNPEIEEATAEASRDR